MDRIELMLVFVRLYETSSFSATARGLGMTQPTVSKRLQALEAGLGTRLIERNTRGLRPTDAGAVYYERCKRWLTEMQDVEEQLVAARRVSRGRLRISVPVSLGQIQLARIALRFQRKHPGLQLDLALSDRLVDLVKEGIDVAIRVGRVGATDVVARELARYEPILVATPEYLQRRGAPQNLAELQARRLLYYGVRDESVFLGGESHKIRRDPDLVVGDPLSLREAVRDPPDTNSRPAPSSASPSRAARASPASPAKLWVTGPGTGDQILQPGQSLPIAGPGRIVLQALTPATFRITPSPA